MYSCLSCHARAVCSHNCCTIVQVQLHNINGDNFVQSSQSLLNCVIRKISFEDKEL